MLDPEPYDVFQRKQRRKLVHINVGDDAVFRDGRIKRVIVSTEQPFFFSRHIQEDERPLGSDLHAGKGAGDLDEARRTGSIVVGAVIDVVALVAGTDAEMVEVSGVDEIFVFQFRIGAGQNGHYVGTGAVFV